MTEHGQRQGRRTGTGPRSALASGYLWASRATAIGLEFALPAVVGVMIDRWLQTEPIAALVGSALGFTAGMIHVFRLAGEAGGPNS